MKGKRIMTTVVVIIGIIVLVEILALLKLAGSVASFQKYWDKNNQEQSAKGNISYVALGDSAAQGVGASRPEKGYVSLIAKALNSKSGGTINTINLSKSGARTADVTEKQLSQLQNLTVSDKTVITLAIGGNDMLTYERTKFQQDMDALLSKVPKQTIVADIAYFGGGRYRRLESNVLEANQIIKELSQKYGLSVAPLHETTKSRQNLFVNSADLFHPSNAGYKNWADAFKQVLGLSSA